MRIVFVAPIRETSGNGTTVERLGGFFKGVGEVVKVNVYDDKCTDEMVAAVEESSIVVVLHAWRAGQVVLEGVKKMCFTPRVIVVFGGTDINEMVHEPEKLSVMTGLVSIAESLVCFSEAMLSICNETWPRIASGKTHVIPQSVTVRPHDSLNSEALTNEFLKTQVGIPLNNDTKIFILPIGVREVKDPLYAPSVFHTIHERYPDAWLLVIGPPLSLPLAGALKSFDKMKTGVIYHEGVQQDVLHMLFSSQYTAGVLNTSLSEGQPQASMEACLCGAPSLLRDISGNACLAPASSVFSSSDELVGLMAKHISDPAFRTVMAHKGQRFIEENFDELTEQRRYCALLRGTRQ